MLSHASPYLANLPNSMKAMIKYDNEYFQEDGNLGLFDGFQEFMWMYMQDQLSLGARMDFKELLVPRYRVHDVSHSNFECCLCQIVVDHIKRKITPT